MSRAPAWTQRHTEWPGTERRHVAQVTHEGDYSAPNRHSGPHGPVYTSAGNVCVAPDEVCGCCGEVDVCNPEVALTFAHLHHRDAREYAVAGDLRALRAQAARRHAKLYRTPTGAAVMSANGPVRDGDVYHPHGDVRAGLEEVRRRAADAHDGNVRGTHSSYARLIDWVGVVHHRGGEVQHRYHEGAPPASWRCAMVTGQGETCVPPGGPALRRAAPACARTPRNARRYAPRAPQSHLAVRAYCNAATRAFVARPRTRRGARVPALALLVTATHDARTLTGSTAMRTVIPTTWHVAFAERTTR